jgi:AsmA-like protein
MRFLFLTRTSVAPGKAKKILLVLIVLLVLFLILLNPILGGIAKSQITKAVEQSLTEPFRLGGFALSIWSGTAHLDNIGVDAPGHADVVSVGSVETSLKFSSILSEQITIDAATVENIKVDLSSDAQGVPWLHRILDPSAPDENSSSSAISQVVAGNLDVRGVAFTGELRENTTEQVQSLQVDNVRMGAITMLKADGPMAGSVDKTTINDVVGEMVDYRLDPPLHHKIEIIRIIMERCAYPASGSQKLWPVLINGRVGVNDKMGKFNVMGGLNHTGEHVNFNMIIELRDIYLPSYSPYLPVEVKHGEVTIIVKAECNNDYLDAKVNGHIKRLWFEPSEDREAKIFGVPQKQVLEGLIRNKNELKISNLHIRGKLSDPSLDFSGMAPMILEWALEAGIKKMLDLPDATSMLNLTEDVVVDPLMIGLPSVEDIKKNIEKQVEGLDVKILEGVKGVLDR